MKRQDPKTFYWASMLLLLVTPLHAAEFYLLNGAGFANEISLDGSTVIGTTTVPPAPLNVPWKWTKDTGLTMLDLLDGTEVGSAVAVSGTGAVIGGRLSAKFGDGLPVMWSQATGWSPMPIDLPVGVTTGQIRLMSHDASTFVIAKPGSDVIVTPNETIHLAHPLEFTIDQPLGISADGNVVVGWRRAPGGPSEPYLWTASDGLQSLGKLDDTSSAWGVSSDGRVVFGTTGEEAWTWTVENSFFKLGMLADHDDHRARAASGDGSVIVGSAGRSHSGAAFVWDGENGMRDLREVLEGEHGIQDLPRRLHRANAISDDGKAIAGYNLDSRDNVRDAWVVQLDRPIVVTSGVAGDFNGNAILDVEDLDLFAKEVRSDRNVNLFDVNSDDAVNFEDRRHWVHTLANTYFGDSNLDGEFNTRDLVGIFEAGEYEDDVPMNSTWATGDWNGDGEFSTSDLVAAFEDGGYEIGPRAAVQSVPEPNGFGVVIIGLYALVRIQRRGPSRG